MIALIPARLTKAYVRGHLRTLAGGRAVQVKPYHTKTAASSREDAKTRDIFSDIPPAENQHRPRIHPARTTTPRKAIVPFQAVYPQLFDDKPLASEQNVHYNKDDKGRNPAPATEGKKMATLNENQKKAMGYLVGIMRTSPTWEKGLYAHALRWAGFNEWSGNDAKQRYYFNDPDEPNEKMFGYVENREVKWNGGYEGAKRKVFKELNAKHVAKMQAVYDKAMDEMKTYIQENRQSLPIAGEGEVGEVRGIPGYEEIGKYVRMENGKWEEKADAPATEGTKIDEKKGQERQEGAIRIGNGEKLHPGYKDPRYGLTITCSCPGTQSGSALQRATFFPGKEPNCQNRGAAPEKPATTNPLDAEKAATSTPRLMAAADFLEKTMAAEGAPSTVEDKADFALVKEAIHKLRTTDRKDLDGAVWASVFSVLKIKNALHVALLLEESEGKKFSAAPKAGRIYLAVPYAEKDKAKATADKAGTRIRFDGDKKKWYWEGEGELPGALAKWAPEGAAPKAETPKQQSNKEIKLAEIKAQIEALKTMPEGTRLSRGDNREMIERRRERYLKEAEAALKAVEEMPEGHFNSEFMKRDVLFDYAT